MSNNKLTNNVTTTNLYGLELPVGSVDLTAFKNLVNGKSKKAIFLNDYYKSCTTQLEIIRTIKKEDGKEVKKTIKTIKLLSITDKNLSEYGLTELVSYNADNKRNDILTNLYYRYCNQIKNPSSRNARQELIALQTVLEYFSISLTESLALAYTRALSVTSAKKADKIVGKAGYKPLTEQSFKRHFFNWLIVVGYFKTAVTELNNKVLESLALMNN